MSKISLDTNAYSDYFRGDNLVKAEIDKAANLYLSVISIGELFLGFKEGSRKKVNSKILKEFITEFRVKVPNVGIITADIYSNIKNNLRRKGVPIPDNDIWIAAQAIEVDSTLVTYDKHFLTIPGLKVWDKLRL